MARHLAPQLARVSGRVGAGGVRFLVDALVILGPIIYAPAVGAGAALIAGVPWWWGAVLVSIVVLYAACDDGSGPSAQRLSDSLYSGYDDSRGRARARQIKREWPRLAERAGWVNADTDGHRPRPALRFVKAVPGRVFLAWRPTDDVKPSDYPAHVAALGRAIGAFSSDWRPAECEPGAIVASYATSPLPDHLPASPTVVGQGGPSEKARTSAVQQTQPLALELGAKAGGGTASWHPDQVNGVLVVGSTGGGKGGALRHLARQVLEADADLLVIDPKATGEWRWAEDRGALIARTTSDAVALLKHATGELRARCDDLAALGAEKVADLPARLRPRPMVVVCDESADLLMLRRTTDEKQNDEQRATCGSLLAVLAMQGRAAWVHPVVALQRPDAVALGPAGGTLRAQLAGRLVLGSLDPDGADMVFGSGGRDAVAEALHGHPGRALASRLTHADGPSPYAVQVAWQPASDLRPVGVAA